MTTTIRGSDNFDTGESRIRSGAVQSASGQTELLFSSIPSWARRIKVVFNGISTAGTSSMLVQLGVGVQQSSGYESTGVYVAATVSPVTSTSGFICGGAGASNVYSGAFTIDLVDGFDYVASISGRATALGAVAGGGRVTLSGTADMIRFTTNTGADTFDAGSVNVSWE